MLQVTAHTRLLIENESYSCGVVEVVRKPHSVHHCTGHWFRNQSLSSFLRSGKIRRILSYQDTLRFKTNSIKVLFVIETTMELFLPNRTQLGEKQLTLETDLYRLLPRYQVRMTQNVKLTV